MSDDSTAVGLPGDDDLENDALMAELRALAVTLDPVPPEVVAAARSAIAWRTMDAELAELTADTSVEPQMAGVRSGDAPAMLTFEAPELTVEIEVIQVGEGRRLLGQLVPPGPGEVEIRHKSGRLAVTADELGRFSASDLAAGPVSLLCRQGSGLVETDWFLA
jgi:hypothetical protein